jgi:DNA-directed RNA polymerase subunit M/transcription elongation factor TFIIS
MIPETITTSVAGQKPVWAEDDDDENDPHKKAASTEKQTVQHATIDEPCPNCDHPELLFYTMQLRSADEGSTVFYECSKCNHKFKQNN